MRRPCIGGRIRRAGARLVAVAGIALAVPCVAVEDPASIGATDHGMSLILDLETAQRIAVSENPSLAAAAARVRQAQARVRLARGAFLPRLELSGGYTKTWLSETASPTGSAQAFGGTTPGVFGSGFFPAGTKAEGLPSETISALLSRATEILQQQRQREAALVDTLEYYRASLTASWTLFNGFERKFNYAAARSGAGESEAAYLEAQRLLLAAVATTFYAGQLAREDLAIARADEAFNSRQLDEAKARRRVGTGSLSDELNFAVRVNAARAELIRADQDYAIALTGLAELMGRTVDTLPEGFELAPLEPGTADEMRRPDAADLIAHAEAHRPDIRQARHALERAEATVGVRRAPFFPTVQATASYDGFSMDDVDFREDDFSSNVGLAVTYTLFAGGQNQARLSEAKAARTEAQRNMESIELTIESEIHQALEDLEASQANLQLQRENATFVERNRDLVEKEYRAGQASLTRLNEAQRDLTQAQGLLALARVSLRQAWHNLRTATGETVAPSAD